MPTPLQQIADKYVPRFASSLESAFNALPNRVTLEIIEDDLARSIKSHPKSLYALVDQTQLVKEVAEPSPAYKELVASVGTMNGIVMDLNSPFVLEAAKKLTADLVTNVGGETKAALRQMIFEAIRDGDAPLQAQFNIRQIVGLTKRDAMRVKRLSMTDPAKAEKLRATLVRRRAITIARTETMRASNLGQKATWQKMMADGFLDPDTFAQKWIVTPDDRLCDLCAPMDGMTVALDEDFESTERGVLPSARVSYAGETVEVPPLHVACRCTLAADFSD